MPDLIVLSQATAEGSGRGSSYFTGADGEGEGDFFFSGSTGYGDGLGGGVGSFLDDDRDGRSFHQEDPLCLL